MNKTKNMGKDIELFSFLLSRWKKELFFNPLEEEIELLLVLNTKDFKVDDAVITIENIGKDKINEFSIKWFRNLRLLSWASQKKQIVSL